MALLDVRFTSYRMGEDVFDVGISGELDLSAADQMRQRLGEVVDGGARSVVVDLLGAGLLDSAALGVLVMFARTLRAADGELVLVTDDRRILKTIQIAGLDGLFRVERSLVEAVQDVIDQRLAR
jgi:anti-sigma B factor antagonist